MARTKIDRAARSPFHLYIDEAQYMAGNIIRPLMSNSTQLGPPVLPHGGMLPEPSFCVR